VKNVKELQGMWIKVFGCMGQAYFEYEAKQKVVDRCYRQKMTRK